MNMFKKNKKPKGHDDALNALSALTAAVPEPKPMVKAHRALTRKKKKIEVVEDTTFDLSSVLPDSNEFRTSLLMPNLSARFSMLREQDDPNSLIGKASDDSVLFPKRASRLNLFNTNYLSDIAEVESIRSSFRPPFADDRVGSMSDGYASDDGGSMLNRSRPGEGNNLFGGRQKLYKITTSSSKNLPGDGGITRGKHTYENDVSLSAFQQLRLREKEQRELDEATDRSSFPNTESEDVESGRSPSHAFSKNRGTQSSTNSGPSNRRTSTAATSVVSESPVPPQTTTNHVITKVKEIDANSSAESIGFASSPGFRKLHDDAGRSSSQLSQSRSPVSSRDNYARQPSANAQSTLHRISPPLSATNQPLDFGLKDTGRSQAVPSHFHIPSPTVQSDFGQDETLANNVRPNDRGKATAMGLFNKPANDYDDAQFQQRQAQMHEGRDSPFSTGSRAASRASPDPRLSRSSHRPSYASMTSPTPQDDLYTPQVPPIPDHAPSPNSFRRSSAASNGPRSSGSRPRTKSSASSKEASVQARVQSLIRKQNAELAAMEENHLGPSRSHTDSDPAILPSPEKEIEQPAFELDNRRDSESRSRRPSTKSVASATIPVPPLPPTDIHPAFRDGIQDFDFGATETRKSSYSARYSNYSAASKIQLLTTDASRQSVRESTLTTDDSESITSPSAGLGLVGLIRTHFRHDTDTSSMLPPPSPAMLNESFRGSVSSTSKTVTESVKSDPFEYENAALDTSAPGPAVEEMPLTPTMIMSQRAQQMLANAAALRDAQAEHEANNRSSAEEADRNNVDETKAEVDTKIHTRSESTETQREQARFDEELAERRRRIQEGLNLKSVQERSRSRSPEADRNRGNGFSLPRFPGRSNTIDRLDAQPQSKAMKMLGLSSTASPRMPGDSFNAEVDYSRNAPSRQGRRPTGDDYEQSSGRQTPSSRPGTRTASRTGHDRPPQPRSTTPSSRPGDRGRSNSAAADRSVSRNKSVPDPDRAKMPGAFPASPFLQESPQNELGQRTDSPAGLRPYERSASSAAGHYQDRQNYFNSKSLAAPGANGDYAPRPSPRPSPNPGENIVNTQLMAPMSPPSSAMPSPNLMNGRSTPTGRSTPSRDRKRSVTKHMISEPTFVSSTSTVPLVHLPRDGGPPVEPLSAPPVPVMNPRRRGNTADQMQFSGQSAIRSLGSPLPVVPASPVVTEFQIPQQTPPKPAPQPRNRNKLRKSSSEGGSIAAKARLQVLMDEMAREKDKSPSLAVFPNKSATSLHMAPQEGGMF